MVRSAAKRRVSNHEALPSCAIHRSRVYPRSDRFNAQVGHGRLAVTPRCARLLRMRAAHSLIHLSNSPSQRRARPACLGIAPRQASSPVFFVEAPGRPVFLVPPQKARGWRAKWRNLVFFSAHVPSRERGGASRRATQTSFTPVWAYLRTFFLTAPGRAFRGPPGCPPLSPHRLALLAAKTGEALKTGRAPRPAVSQLLAGSP
jgi:hypothetical protein